MLFVERRLFQCGETSSLFRLFARVEFNKLSNQVATSLNIIFSVIKETLRWRPTLPLAVLHRLEQGNNGEAAYIRSDPDHASVDDIYNGYFLPKDSTGALFPICQLIPFSESFIFG